MPLESIQTNASVECDIQIIDDKLVLSNSPTCVMPIPVVPRIFLITFIIPSYLLFPIFLFVQRQNQESDALTSVYPIVKHFNYVVKKMMVLLTISIVLVCLGFYFNHMFEMIDTSKELSTFSVTMVIFVIIYGITVLSVIFLISFVPNVQYVLHFLLGLQRLLIYFFPEQEKYISWSGKRLNTLLAVLYFIFFVLDLRTAYYVYANYQRNLMQDGDQYTVIQVNIIIFLFLNFLQVLGALFYIPIMRSVSKLAHLTSAAINRPQKYLFYQILILLISRIGYLPTFFVSNNNFELMMIIVAYDIILTPFVIQLAYVLCNRRNVQTLLSSPWKVIIWSLIGRSYQPPQVHPATVIESTKI